MSIEEERKRRAREHLAAARAKKTALMELTTREIMMAPTVVKVTVGEALDDLIAAVTFLAEG